MVISGVAEVDRQQKSMSMTRERSKLHNFTMPCLKWANQKILRCMKVNSNGEISDRRSSPSEAESEDWIGDRTGTEVETCRSSGILIKFKKSASPPNGVSGRRSKVEGDGDKGIEATKEKLMFDVRAAADRMKASIEDEESSDAAAAAARPWNLRKRRAACKAPSENEIRETLKIEDRRINSSPVRTENLTIKSLRLKGAAVPRDSEKKEMNKFSISLSRKEIEEDFLLMAGTRPSRRPKKRAKIVQKHLDTLFPGLWLSQITPDSYKVSEIPETGKR